MVFLAVIAVAVASPWGRSRSSRSDEEGALYPSGGRGRPVSTRRTQVPSSPHFFYRSPRYRSFREAEDAQPGPQYRLYREPRDDDDDDSDEDDVQDDVGDDDDDDVQDDEFDTPTWEEMFPPKKNQGQESYGGLSQGSGPPPSDNLGGGPEIQQDTGSFEISPNGPGGQNWASGIEGQARSQFVPMSAGAQKRFRPVTVRVSKPRSYKEMVPVKRVSTSGGPRWVVSRPTSSRNQQWWPQPQRQQMSYASNRRWSQGSSHRQPAYYQYPMRRWSGRQQRREQKHQGYWTYE